jgi:hydrogenase/urease accessory protein HupE
MKTAFAALVGWLAVAAVAEAHPAPFSYIDARIGTDAIQVSLVVHIFDVAHDLNVDPPERLLEPAFLDAHAQDVIRMLTPRFRLGTNGQSPSPLVWSRLEPLPERQSVRVQATVRVDGVPPVVAIDTLMFPYDIAHQTFVNIYESDQVALQAILDRSKTRLDFYTASPGGRVAVFRGFVGDGLRHVFLGPEHLIFLIGLVLLGGSGRKLTIIVVAFAVAHTLAFTLGALGLLRSPTRLIEPGIALTIIYLGADNLMVRGGKDVRIWIAAAFGALHGLGFAGTIRALDLSQYSVRWSIVGFTLGLTLAEAGFVIAAGTVIERLRRRDEHFSRRLVFAGSFAIIAAGTVWFVQRVFFPGGFA